MEQTTIRQKEIIAAALAIISERGLEALTIKNIAARMGFSDAAVYRHFQNKSHILSTMVDSFAISSIQELNRIATGKSSGLDKIKRFFLDRCRTFAADQALATVMFAEDLFKSDPTLAAKIHCVMHDHRQLLLKSIRQGQRQGVFIHLPAEHLFTIIMGSLRLLVLQWQVSGYDSDLLRTGEKLWHSLEMLIGKENRRLS
jgi:AcrR family transcriptional regulator